MSPKPGQTEIAGAQRATTDGQHTPQLEITTPAQPGQTLGMVFKTPVKPGWRERGGTEIMASCLSGRTRRIPTINCRMTANRLEK